MLDECSDFRDNLGEVADNIALGTTMEEFWAERQASNAAASSSEPGMLPGAIGVTFHLAFDVAFQQPCPQNLK